MKIKFIIGLFALTLAYGCSTVNKLPSTEVITNTAATIDLAQGKIYMKENVVDVIVFMSLLNLQLLNGNLS